jgi:hypothetical protein
MIVRNSYRSHYRRMVPRLLVLQRQVVPD